MWLHFSITPCAHPAAGARTALVSQWEYRQILEESTSGSPSWWECLLLHLHWGLLAKPLARATSRACSGTERATGTPASWCARGMFSMPINTLLLPWPRKGAGPGGLPGSGLVIPRNPHVCITARDTAALLEPPYADSTTGSPMWLPGSHTLSNPHPNLQSSSFHRFVLSLWEPDASHLFQCQMKLNICSFQGLWLAINKLANKDLVCWGVGGVCEGCRRVDMCEGGMQGGMQGFVYIFLLPNL